VIRTMPQPTGRLEVQHPLQKSAPGIVRPAPLGGRASSAIRGLGLQASCLAIITGGMRRQELSRNIRANAAAPEQGLADQIVSESDARRQLRRRCLNPGLTYVASRPNLTADAFRHRIEDSSIGLLEDH